MSRKFFSVLITAIAFMMSGSLVFGQTSADVRPQTATQDQIEILRQKGFGFLKIGKWSEASEVFQSLLTKIPDDYLALYGNGLALYNQRRINEADENIGKAIEILSKKNLNQKLLADSLVLSAVISATKNENSEAVKKLERAVNIAPDNFDASFTLGRVYFGNKNFEGAVKAFRSAAKLQPNHLQARFFLANALEKNSDLSEALNEYRAILKLNQNYADANTGLGVLLIKMEGETSIEGINALQKSIALNENSYEARVTLGKSLIKLNRLEEAVTHLRKAAELVPENPEPHFQLSLAYRKLGKKDEAAAEAEKVKEIHRARRGVSGN